MALLVVTEGATLEMAGADVANAEVVGVEEIGADEVDAGVADGGAVLLETGWGGKVDPLPPGATIVTGTPAPAQMAFMTVMAAAR